MTYYSKNFKNFEQSTDTDILIRPHPGDTSNTTSMIKQKFNVKNFTVSNMSLFEDLMVSDVVVTTISAVSVDATILKNQYCLLILVVHQNNL